MKSTTRFSHLIMVIVLAFAAACVFQPPEAEASKVARERIFGLGGTVGTFFGGTGKVYLTDIFAIQFGTGFKTWGGWFFNHVDFCWHPWFITKNRHFELHFYFGFGPALGLKGSNDVDPSFWLRFPIGVSFRFEKIPLEAFTESGPLPGWAWYDQPRDNVDFIFNWFWTAGARYYF